MTTFNQVNDYAHIVIEVFLTYQHMQIARCVFISLQHIFFILRQYDLITPGFVLLSKTLRNTNTIQSPGVEKAYCITDFSNASVLKAIFTSKGKQKVAKIGVKVKLKYSWNQYQIHIKQLCLFVLPLMQFTTCHLPSAT